ncbi:hypothetical protein ACFQH5_20210 [Halomonas salifodinae]|uniref:Uncharacterized protein n=1 Tax=Halomonas salifodinae TaxID=438745 RepID=A0ABW2F4N3_9GAMM
MARPRSTANKASQAETGPQEDAKQEDVLKAGAHLEELRQANEEFNSENERLRAQLAEMEQRMAKNTPVTREQRLETGEHQVGQDGTAAFDGDTLIKPETRTLDDPNLIKKAEILKFMEEPVTVEISEVSDENADHGFIIHVNGKSEPFRQGERKTVKRYFVEGLARAKRTGYKNQLVVDPVTGDQEYEYPSKTGLRYPFSVVHDPNPRGADWLKAVLRQP